MGSSGLSMCRSARWVELLTRIRPRRTLRRFAVSLRVLPSQPPHHMPRHQLALCHDTTLAERL